ncbi:IS66 family transposase [Thomasclavelia cocleata]|uniref:IS66 family transposase n=1 Tax=Thomasclavelia cocleata TaxID=69824 RepID=UPI00338D35C4
MYHILKFSKNTICWAHLRRRFQDALSDDIQDISNTLAKTDSLSAEEKIKIRNEKSKPILDEFFSWCSDNQNKVLAYSK